MKISLQWLKEYVDVVLPPRELAHRLTMAGTEVASVTIIGEGWENVTVAEVMELARHPNADRLLLCTLDLGGGRTQTVVTGAPNLGVGQRVPFAPVGTRLIDGHTGKPMVLKPARIRGVPSEGMVCSEKELGISEAHEGIMVLPPDAPVGAPLVDYLGDVILDLEVTPNRPDLLSVLGVAREVAALTGQPLRLPDLTYPEADTAAAALASVRIDDPDLCSRYTASLILDVTIGPSPRWMQARLEAAGSRPINNIVDITNYVMLEYGQPLHAFDYEKLRQRQIIVRRAWPEEILVSLDGEERRLSPQFLAIADAEGAVAVAGVMGGANSEVAEETRHILLESANFNPVSIRRTSAALRMRTEASIRFEKGLPPELAEWGLRRATQLIAELGGGRAARGILDVYPGRRARPPLEVPLSEFTRLLGAEFTAAQVTEVLESLGFECHKVDREGGAVVLATPPMHRSDVNLIADVVEEVARIVGYDALPIRRLRAELPEQQVDLGRDIAERTRDILVGCGLQEIITYPLVGEALLHKPYLNVAPPTPIRVANPMSVEQEFLRTSMRGSVLGTLAANRRHQGNGVHIFEVGKVFLPREGDLPDERRVLAGAMSGPRLPLSWADRRDAVDFYDAKGVVETLLERLRYRAEFAPATDPSLHPGKTARIEVDGRAVGVVGEIHPLVAERFELTEPTYLFEIDLPALLEAPRADLRYQTIPRFPAVERDLAIVVDQAVPAQQVQRIIAAAPLVSQVALFDVYTGAPLPEGKKSLAFSILYQSPSRTLTDEEVDRIQGRTIARLREMGASIRE